MTLNPALVKAETTPGEFFWFGRKMFRVGYIVHIYLSISQYRNFLLPVGLYQLTDISVGGIFVGAQFLPGLRRVSIPEAANGHLNDFQH